MTLAATIQAIDDGRSESARLKVIYQAYRDAAVTVGDLDGEAIWTANMVVCDAIDDALRKADEGCTEAS